MIQEMFRGEQNTRLWFMAFFAQLKQTLLEITDSNPSKIKSRTRGAEQSKCQLQNNCKSSRQKGY